MATSLEAFTMTPRSRAEHLAVVLVLGGPLGPFNTPEDYENLRQKIYSSLDDDAFEGLLDLVTQFHNAAERGLHEEEEVIWMLSHCLGTAIDGKEERWARVYALLQDPATREVAGSSIFWLGSPHPIPWLENRLTRPDLSSDEREEYEGLLDLLRRRNGLPAVATKSH